MDARLDHAKFAVLPEGDVHVTRNAGARASDDAICSLVFSCKLLGTQEWYAIHQSTCGMEFFTNNVMRRLVSQSLAMAVLRPHGFKDVRRIHEHPLVPGRIPIYSLIYQVQTGELKEVKGSCLVGTAQG
jgi:carbonic anhydrase